MASFTSLGFLFRFLPIFLIVYYFVPSKFKNLVALLGSLVFYSLGEPIFVFLLIFLSLVNFFIANASCRAKKSTSKKKNRPKIYLILVILLDLISLVTFKVLIAAGFNVLLPLGLSFYTFKMLSYQIDVYRGTIKEGPSILEVITYFCIFPQVAEGPIMRFREGDFLNEKKITLLNIENGLRYFIPGLAMKVLLADRIGILWNDLGMYGYESISTSLAWLGAFAYSFELYFDFWGYSLMASGLMVAMGYEFIENFNHPYASNSISEFYRRWHITLGSFFRDYVYFPLGGSRTSKPKMVFNLSLVWILTGIWHGNSLNFILWGVMLGLFIILEKLFYGEFLKKNRIIGNIYVLILVPLSWVVFAISDFTKMGTYFSRLFPFFTTAQVVDQGDIFTYLGDYWYLIIAAVLLCIPKITDLFRKYKDTVVVKILLVLLFWYSVYFCTISEGNPFMYLNF